ncbi:hypothetical protein [Nisaea sp.]|uniref:hypothetical protein n=1 Tax=Nisaea sp. TaxID=2024842 RepID=UPI003B524BD9
MFEKAGLMADHGLPPVSYGAKREDQPRLEFARAFLDRQVENFVHSVQTRSAHRERRITRQNQTLNWFSIENLFAQMLPSNNAHFGSSADPVQTFSEM